MNLFSYWIQKRNNKKIFLKNSFGWKINLIDTGNNTMTEVVKRLTKYLNKENFFLLMVMVFQM